MNPLTWQNPEQLFVAQVLINKVKSKCCGIKDKYITFKNNINTPTFCSSTATRIPMRYYGFNISWRFGELKAQVKKAARSINNDDLKSGGGNAGTGGGIPAN